MSYTLKVSLNFVKNSFRIYETFSGPGRSRTACLRIANATFNQVNFGPGSFHLSYSIVKSPWVHPPRLPSRLLVLFPPKADRQYTARRATLEGLMVSKLVNMNSLAKQPIKKPRLMRGYIYSTNQLHTQTLPELL